MKITVGHPLISLSEKVIKDLSTDQYYGYMIVSAIRSGELPQRLAHRDRSSMPLKVADYSLQVLQNLGLPSWPKGKKSYKP